MPKTNSTWWLNKINTNKANDAKAARELKKVGWRLIEVWECKLKPAKIERTMEGLLNKTRNSNP